MTDKDLGQDKKTVSDICVCVLVLCVPKVGFGAVLACHRGFRVGKGKHNRQGNPTTEWKLEMNTLTHSTRC